MVEASCKYRINLNPYIFKGIIVTDTIKLVEQPVGSGRVGIMNISQVTPLFSTLPSEASKL